MEWHNQFPKSQQPGWQEICQYVNSPYWQALCQYIEETYAVAPLVEHSICSGAPGWNVKYKKSGRALCTLYPDQGFFTCMISIAPKDEAAAHLLMGECTPQVQQVYQQSKPAAMGRWMMIPVTAPEILADIKLLLGLRASPKGTR